MKVILTMDVADVGSRGDRVDVAAGFARNYLIPRRLAVHETAGNLRAMEEEGKLTGVRDRKAKREAEKVQAFLNEHELFTTLKIGREGKAFGAVTAKEISILLRRAGLEVDRRRIRLDSPIKRLGRFEIPFAIHADVETTIKVFVDREGGTKEGALAEQEVHNEKLRALEEVAKAEAEARAQREKEAEEAARVAIEKAQARKAREEEEARAREEARKGQVLEDKKTAADDAEAESGADEAPGEKEGSAESAPEKA
jgi:large subunit ribosomal protein L9